MITKKWLLLVIPILLVSAGVLISYAGAERIEKNFRLLGPMTRFHLGLVLTPPPEKGGGGAVVERVLSDSPADRAGIKEGDILKRIDGHEVSDAGDVQSYLRKLDEERSVDLEIERNGKEITIPVKPEERPITAEIAMGGGYLGVDLQELNPDLADYFKADPRNGVLVTSVEKDSPADQAGIRAGDIITSLDGKAVRTPREVREAINDLKDGTTVPITVLRHGSTKNLSARIVERGFSMPDIPDLSELQKELPEIRQHFNSPEFRKQMEELQSPEFRAEMEKLKQQMEELKVQIQQLKKQDLEKMKKDLEKQMQQLKKELEQRKKET